GQAASVITVPPGGVVQNTTTIVSSFPTAAQVLIVPPAVSVTINNITVDGAGNNIQTCDLELIGIYFRNVSGQVTHSATVNQVPPPGFDGCQSGEGIWAHTATGGTINVNVNNSVVENFGKNGITGNETGTNLLATSNVIVGRGPTTAAENGIQIA